MTSVDLAASSNTSIAFASIVYALAFLSHLVEWALGRKVPVEGVEPTGARSAVVAAHGTTRASYAPGSASYPVEAAQGSEDPDDLDDKRLGIEKFGRIGIALTLVAAGLHLAGLVTRGLGAEPARVPWGNMYEFSLAGSFAVVVMYLALLRRHSLRWLGPVVSGFALAILMLSVLVLYVPAGPLVPALDSYWLVIHVVAAIIATGAFTVGGMASVLFLVRSRAEERGAVRSVGYLARLPEAKVLDRIAYRFHAFGFPVWTFAALIAGPIWAEYAWGRYWNWDPKEIWAFITWVVYASYLHARATTGWKGKAAAVIALIGLATLLFNFVGINFFFGSTSQHSYAG